MYGYQGSRVLRLILEASPLRPLSLDVTGIARLKSAPKVVYRIPHGPLRHPDWRVALKPVKVEDSMEPGALSLSHDAQVQTVEDDELHSSANIKERSNAEKKKAKKKKKQNRRPKERKLKSKSSECPGSLLAELPFVHEEGWKDLGFVTSKKSLNKKRKKEEGGQSQSKEDDTKKAKQRRPNYFVSIPITNPEITGAIKAVQDLVIQKDNRLSQALVPVASLHITLMVIYLGSEEEVSAAVGAMGQAEQALQDQLPAKRLILPFTGIGHFRNEVVFAQLASGEHTQALAAIAEAVRTAFEERGIPSSESRTLQPHLTFMKLSKAPRLRRQGIRKLDPSLYAEFLEHRFGDELVSRLDLCAMLKKKTPDGYYHCEASVALGQKRGSEPDDEELVSLSKRLVEDAVLKAVQQYMEETQRGVAGAPDKGPPPALSGDHLGTGGSK